MKSIRNGIYIFHLLILIFLWTTCPAQTRFNIVSDFGHRKMNVFNSITPLDDGYIIIIGTRHPLYNDNRCSMVVKTDSEGNKLYSAFIGDAQYDVFEGGVSASSVYTTETGTYKFIFNIGPDIKLQSYEFDDSLRILDATRLNTDSTNRPLLLCNIYIEDNIYMGGQYENFCEYLTKYDANGNVIAEAERRDHIGIRKIIGGQDGNIIVSGLRNYNNHDWIIQKLDTSLNIIWHKTYGRSDMKNGFQTAYYLV